MSVPRVIAKKWLSLIRKAREDKWEKFSKAAAESMLFYGADDHSFIFRREYASSSGLRYKTSDGDTESGLTFEATANLVSNVVSVFLPVLYHRNPVRTIKPRRPMLPNQLLNEYRTLQIQKSLSMIQQQFQLDPNAMMAAEQGAMMQMQQLESDRRLGDVEDALRAGLLEWYMNYTPRELDLKSRARDAIIESLVKGAGVMWAVLDEKDERKITGLEYDSIDHLFIDPDAERLEDAKWIARRKRRPVWEVEREFELEPGSLKPSESSTESQADEDLKDDFDAKFDSAEGMSSDLVTYYEVWSRMGVGNRIAGGFEDDIDEGVIETLEAFGDNAFIVVSPTHDFPLNLPEAICYQPDQDQAAIEVKERLSWPVQFHKNRRNPWPMGMISFRRVPRQVWPQSYIWPAMGYQKCINWILSFLMARIKITSRAFLVVPQGIDEELKDAILSGKDLTLLEINTTHPGTMDQLIQFIKMPEENANIWNLLAQLKREFEDATGVTELNMSARTSQQMRSAAEADLKRDILSVRPDDMANEVDTWMSNLAFIEAIAARSLLTGEDVGPVFGEYEGDGEFTQMWLNLVQTDDVDRIVSEFEYSVESGSARKPNQQQEVQNVDEGTQMIVQQFISVWNVTGDPSKFNAWIDRWCKSRGMEKPEDMYLPDMQAQIQQQQAMAMMQGGAPPPEGGGPPQQEQQQGPPQQ